MTRAALLLILLSISWLCEGQVNADSLLREVVAHWDNVRFIEYTSHREERQFNDYIKSEMLFTVQRSPFKAAGVMMDGSERHIVVYDSERSLNTALYIPDGFPYTNLNLDIHGSLFRGKNHYTISEAGFEPILKLVYDQVRRTPNLFQCSKEFRSGELVYVLRAQNNQFAFVQHRPRTGQTVMDVAHELGVSAYLILERNPQLSSYTQDVGNKPIRVPTHFGKAIRMEIPARVKLPTLVEIYDDRGLVERFRFSNLRLKTTIPADFFSEEYLDKLY